MSDESVIEFPCKFPIKVMGKSSGEFEPLALDIIRRHAPDISEDAITSRASKDGNYVSITVTIQASSRAQLDVIYRELTGHPQVLMAL